MKKIPTLFVREFKDHKIVGITDKITPGCEEAFLHGKATIKYDGACCAIIDGKFYKRFDAKEGRKIPEGAIPCCDPDPVTGHWPHWVEIREDNPADKWFIEAFRNTSDEYLDSENRTLEAVGEHFNGNPYELATDFLLYHGEDLIKVKRTFDDVREYLQGHYVEGIVFWLNGEPVCKIKRTDFGFDWNGKSSKR